jgi:hypothetical protein
MPSLETPIKTENTMATVTTPFTGLPSRAIVTEPDEECAGDALAINKVTDEELLDLLIEDDNNKTRESYFHRPLELLPLIEREAHRDMPWLVVNDAHDCIHDRNCTLRPLKVVLYRISEGTNETLHICFPGSCKHLGGPTHRCTVPDTCPHRFRYAARDVYVYEALYSCDRVGRLHLCGKHCRSKFTDLARGGLHTCPLTGIVLQSQLEGPMDNYQRQIMGAESFDHEDEMGAIKGAADEDNNNDPALLSGAGGGAGGGGRRMQPSVLLLTNGITSEMSEETLQQQTAEWEKIAHEVVVDVLTTTKVSPMQVVAPVLELLTALRAKKQIAAVESGEISIVDMIARVYKVLPPPHKIHPAWRTVAAGENPLKLPMPINKDNIRRWKRVHQLFNGGHSAAPFRGGAPNVYVSISRMAVESYMMYAHKSLEVHSKVTYSFKQFLPYILYQMRHGLSVPLYTPKIGVKHSTVPLICIIPKLDIMDHLPPADLFEKYTSVKKHGLNARTLSRIQKITSFIIEMYHTVG